MNQVMPRYTCAAIQSADYAIGETCHTDSIHVNCGVSAYNVIYISVISLPPQLRVIKNLVSIITLLCLLGTAVVRLKRYDSTRKVNRNMLAYNRG